MTMTETPTPVYRFSVLGTGLLRMWRATAVVLPVIIVNSLVQALLILPTQSAFSGITLALTGLVSALVLLATFGVTVAAALDSHGPDRPTWAGVRARVAGAWGPFAVWTVGLFVVVTAGFAFWTWPGAVLLAAGLLIPLAAMDRRSPLRATWSVIRQRPMRWIVTVVVLLVLALLGFLLTGVLWFFVPQFLGVVIAGLAWGLLIWWWTTGLAALYLAVERD